MRREGDDDKYVNARELKRENAEIKRRNEGVPEAEKEPTWEKVYLYRENGGRSNHTKAEAEARGLDPVHDRVRKQPVQKTRYLTDWNDRDRAEIWRGQWAERINEALEDAGHDERVDHRSYARQGIEREPMRHEGPKVTAIERQEAKRARKEERAPEPATDVRRDNVDLAALNQRVAAARAAIDREWDKLARDVREAVARAREGFRTGIDRARDLLRRSLRRPERAPAGQTRAVYREQERERARRHHGHSAWDRDRAREAERRHAQEQEQKRRREREKRKERPQQRERGTGRSWSPPREDAGRDYGPTIGRGR